MSRNRGKCLSKALSLYVLNQACGCQPLVVQIRDRIEHSLAAILTTVSTPMHQDLYRFPVRGSITERLFLSSMPVKTTSPALRACRRENAALGTDDIGAVDFINGDGLQTGELKEVGHSAPHTIVRTSIYHIRPCAHTAFRFWLQISVPTARTNPQLNPDTRIKRCAGASCRSPTVLSGP